MKEGIKMGVETLVKKAKQETRMSDCVKKHFSRFLSLL